MELVSHCFRNITIAESRMVRERFPEPVSPDPPDQSQAVAVPALSIPEPDRHLRIAKPDPAMDDALAAAPGKRNRAIPQASLAAREIIFAFLIETANCCRICPSDRTIGARFGITKSRINDHIQALVKAGRITTKVRPGRNAYRIVTITATGKRTAERR